jgi:hypothetical protein
MKKVMMFLLFFSVVSASQLLAQSGSCAKACAKACTTADVKKCPPGCKPGDPNCEIKCKTESSTASANGQKGTNSTAKAVSYDPFPQSYANSTPAKACCNAPKTQATTAANKPAKTAVIASVDKR